MLTPNFSDALLVFLYGSMATLFVQWVVERFKVKERVEWPESSAYETRCRLLDFEEDMDSIKDFVRRAEAQREKERPERRTRARSPRRVKK